MATDGAPKRQKYNFAVRSTDLDAPTLVDRIGVALLQHLCVCGTCFAVFAAQQDLLETAGCVEGMRIVSHSRVKWEERRASLASSHINEGTLDDYLFGRLTSDEDDALIHHAAECLRCARAIVDRQQLIACIKSALSKRPLLTHQGTALVGAVSVQLPSYSFGVARPLVSSQTPVVVIVHRSNSVVSLTRTQLRFFFLRLISHWPWGATIMPVDLPQDSETRADFTRKWLKLAPTDVWAYWIDQEHRRGIERPLVLTGSKEAKEWVALHPGAISYVQTEDVDEMVREIEVTG
jgi:hypothetical protein